MVLYMYRTHVSQISDWLSMRMPRCDATAGRETPLRGPSCGVVGVGGETQEVVLCFTQLVAGLQNFPARCVRPEGSGAGRMLADTDRQRSADIEDASRLEDNPVSSDDPPVAAGNEGAPQVCTCLSVYLSTSATRFCVHSSVPICVSVHASTR